MKGGKNYEDSNFEKFIFFQNDPAQRGLKNGCPPEVKIFFLTDVWFMVFKMTAQNTQTQQKNGNVLACLRAEIFVKNQAVWFGWGFLGSFS